MATTAKPRSNKTTRLFNPYRASTLFALIFGEIAYKIKNGRNPLKSLEEVTLGYEKDIESKPSCLIRNKAGQWFRLTVEPVSAPRSGFSRGRWKDRGEDDL